VKRSGRDEPTCVVIHVYMESMLGISLYSYLYLTLGKTPYFPFYLVWFFFFKKIGEQEGGTGSAQRLGVGEVAQIMYTHISKCKNNKIKIFKK
jgi:hypothetical protein